MHNHVNVIGKTIKNALVDGGVALNVYSLEFLKSIRDKLMHILQRKKTTL